MPLQLPVNFPFLPVAELHVHIEGTLGNPLIFELADRNKIELPFDSPEELNKLYKFQNLHEFLDLYFKCLNVLQSEDDFHDLMVAYLANAKQNKILHSEIFFNPQAHTRRGVRFEAVVEGLLAGMAKGKELFGISTELIMDFLRDMSVESAMDTLDHALPYRDRIIGIGLDSQEAGNPPSKFRPVFMRAKKEGIRKRTAHAEVVPAEYGYIWQALDLLEVDRIDHGYPCRFDRRLSNRLVQDKIPMTWCPFAAVAVQYYEDIETLALDMKAMLDLDFCISCHSDDPAYFGGNLQDNLLATYQAGRLQPKHIRQLAENSFRAAWISEAKRQQYLNTVDIDYHTWLGSF